MRVWAQSAHCSTWPPSSAVRQSSTALMTRRCARLRCPSLAARQAGPKRRKMSATSSRGLRHYGLLANGHRAAMLARCRELLDVPPAPAEADGGEDREERRGTKAAVPACPCCGGPMLIVERLPGPTSRRYPARKPDGW